MPDTQSRIPVERLVSPGEKLFDRIVGDPSGGLSRALWPVERLYGAVVCWKRRAYVKNLLRSQSVGAPTMSLGNLTLGGTGKTPMAELTARTLLDLGQRPAIVSRGYGGKVGVLSDENAMLRQRLPKALVIGNPDRVAGAREAIARGATCIVLDDAFQHLRIRRDLDIVLVDATAGFGNGRLFPRGILREPPETLARADAVILTKVNLVSTEDVEALRGMVGSFFSKGPILSAEHIVVDVRPVRNLRKGEGQVDNLTARHALAKPEELRFVGVCGIARPESFARLMKQQSWDVARVLAFPDHHSYTPKDVARIREIVVREGAQAVITTEKDLGKLSLHWHWNTPLFVLSIACKVREREQFEELIHDFLARGERRITQGGA